MQLTVDRETDQLAVSLFDRPSDTFVIIFPAMGVPGSYYGRFAKALNEAGVSAAIMDLRGTGASRPIPSRASRYGYRELVDDVGAVLEALAPQRAGKRTILLGHSLGGQACLMHLSHTQTGVDGLVLVGVGLPYWRSYGRRGLTILGFTQAIAATGALLGVWPGWGFGGRQARGVMRDWGYTGRHGEYPPHLNVDLGNVTLPVLAISVEPDQYTPAPTIDHLVAKLPNAPVRREHLTRDTAGVELDHFKWVKAGEPLAKLILDWQFN